MALMLAEYGYKLLQPDKSGVGMEVTSMVVLAPYIVKNILKPESQKLQIKATVSIAHQKATVMIGSPAESDASGTVHATSIVKYESESA